MTTNPTQHQEAGATVSKRNLGLLREVATGVNKVMYPMMELIGMHPREAVAGLFRESETPTPEQLAEAEDARILRESANIAEWYEAQIHKMFTCMADEQFGYGQITRPERLALSSAIGRGLDAFRAQLQDSAPSLYDRFLWDKVPEESEGDMEESAVPQQLGEGGTTHLHEVGLREAAVAADGTFDACLITPGWGSSGYYSKEVLERDGPKIFTEGLQMFFDHATEREKQERPEGSVLNLGATLKTGATWRESGWKGPGLYATAEAINTQRESINALAPAVGLSIDAFGIGRMGEAEGRKGVIIERLTAAQSVDIVTRAGRGGGIRVRESAHNQETTMSDFNAQLSEAAIKEMRESIQALQATNARLARESQIAAGERVIRSALDQAELPPLAKSRIAESLRPVLGDDDTLDRAATLGAVEKAINNEINYLAQLTGRGRVAGMGGSAPAVTVESAQARLDKAFKRIGLSESAAAIAAEGR